MASWARTCGFEPAMHHRLLIEKLEAVVRGKIKKLAFFLPPGSAKSTYASVLFPPWFLAQKPRSTILLCGHNVDLVRSFGRRARNLIETYSSEIGYALSTDSKAADEWTTTGQGLFFSAGVGAGIAGHRADLGLIDDPVGKKEDADSKLFRDRVWEWFLWDFRFRLNPGAAQILIQTRWHEDDLAGRILATERSEWEVVHIPLIAEEHDVLGRAVGERLWPEHFTLEQVNDARKDPRAFSALCQGRPAPESGDFFKREWLIPYMLDDLPQNLCVYCASDHAISEAQAADLTCLLAVGVDEHGLIYILPDIWWKREDDGSKIVDAMLEMSQRRKPLYWWAEKGHISKSLGGFLRKRMYERNIFIPLEEVTPVRDKRTRAQSIRARMSMGQVRFPAFAPWWPDAMHELLSFDSGKHDDFVDALAHVGRQLDRLVHAEPRMEIVAEESMSPARPTFRWLKERDLAYRNAQAVDALDR